MSQAQKKQEPAVEVRTTPPPLSPRHSQMKLRSTLPPLAAERRLSSPPEPSSAPRLSVPPPAHLALVPLWDDADLPLRPSTKPTAAKNRWIGGTTVGVAVGALVAASILSLRMSDYAQIIPYGAAEPSAHAQSAQGQLMAAAAAVPAEAVVEIFELDEPLEFSLSEIEALDAAMTPIVIPELRVTSKPVKGAKAKPIKIKPPYRAPKPRGKRGKRGRTMPAAISPAVATAAEPAAASQLEAAATAAPERLEAVESAAAQPLEAIATASEPQLKAAEPALPENLSRAQVKRGLEGVRSKVLGCAHGTYGRILADVTISAPGQVSSAVIEGTFAGTKAAACMVQTISQAKFPAFSGPDISVRYPYSF